MTLPPHPSLMEGGSSRRERAVLIACTKISPPWLASRWEMTFAPDFLGCSNITALPKKKKNEFYLQDKILNI